MRVINPITSRRKSSETSFCFVRIESNQHFRNATDSGSDSDVAANERFLLTYLNWSYAKFGNIKLTLVKGKLLIEFVLSSQNEGRCYLV